VKDGIGSRWFTLLFSAVHASVYHVTGGRVGGRWGRASILLLTTRRPYGGARTRPLLYLQDGESLAVVATNDGARQEPGWCRDLRREPRAEVQAGSATYLVQAEFAAPEEKARLWPLLIEMYPSYDRDRARAQRELPIVVLRRTAR